MKPTPDASTIELPSRVEQQQHDYSAMWIKAYASTGKELDPSIRNYRATQVASMAVPAVDQGTPITGVNLGRRPLGLNRALAAQTGDNLPEDLQHYVPMSQTGATPVDTTVADRARHNAAERAIGYGPMMTQGPSALATAGGSPLTVMNIAAQIPDPVMQPAIAVMQAVDAAWENVIAEPLSASWLAADYFVNNVTKDGFQISDATKAAADAWENKNYISFGQAISGNVVNNAARIASLFGLQGPTIDLEHPGVVQNTKDDYLAFSLGSGALDFGLNLIPIPGGVAVKATRRAMGLGTEVRAGMNGVADLAIIRRDLNDHMLFRLTNGQQGRYTDIGAQAEKAASSDDILQIKNIPMISNQQGMPKASVAALHRINKDPLVAGDMFLASVGDADAVVRLVQRAPDLSYALGRMGEQLKTAVLTGVKRSPEQEKILDAAFESSVQREEWSKALVDTFFKPNPDDGEYGLAVLGHWMPTSGRSLNPSSLQRAIEPATIKMSRGMEAARGAAYDVVAWRESGNIAHLPSVVEKLIQTTPNGPVVRLIKFPMRSIQWATSKSPLNVYQYSGTRPDDIIVELLARMEEVDGLKTGGQFPIDLTTVDGNLTKVYKPAEELRRQWIERVALATADGPAATHNAVMSVEDDMFRGLAIEHGLTPAEAEDVLAQVRARAGVATDSLKKNGYFYDEGGTQVLFGDKAATVAQLVDHEYLLDMAKIQANMKHLKDGLGKTLYSGGQKAQNLIDYAGAVWRTDMLLKPGYTFRNSMMEPGVSLFISQLGYWLSVPGLQSFAKGWSNFAKNNVRRFQRLALGPHLRSQSRELAQEYKVLATDFTNLSLQRDQLAAEVRMLQGVKSRAGELDEAEYHLQLANNQLALMEQDMLATGVFRPSDFAVPSITDVHARFDEMVDVLDNENSLVIQRLYDERAARWAAEPEVWPEFKPKSHKWVEGDRTVGSTDEFGDVIESGKTYTYGDITVEHNTIPDVYGEKPVDQFLVLRPENGDFHSGYEYYDTLDDAKARAVELQNADDRLAHGVQHAGLAWKQISDGEGKAYSLGDYIVIDHGNDTFSAVDINGRAAFGAYNRFKSLRAAQKHVESRLVKQAKDKAQINLDLTPPDLSSIDVQKLRSGTIGDDFFGTESTGDLSAIKETLFGDTYYSGLSDAEEGAMLADVIDLMNVDDKYARLVNLNRSLRTGGLAQGTLDSLESAGILFTPKRLIELAQDRDMKQAIAMYNRGVVNDLESEIQRRIDSGEVFGGYPDGTVYHGGAFPEEGFTEAPIETWSNVTNLHGIGVYTTEAGPIAAGYLKTGDGPRDGIYYIKMTADDKAAFLDLDKAASDSISHEQLDQIIDRMRTHINEKYGIEVLDSDARREAHEMLDTGMSGSDLRHRLTNSTFRDLPFAKADDTHRQFDSQMAWVEALKEQGFRGVRHVGGFNTGNEPHNVFIWYTKPERDNEIRPILDLQDDTVALREAQQASDLANDSLVKAGTAHAWESLKTKYDSWLTDLKDLSEDEMSALRMALTEADVKQIALKDSDGVVRKVSAMTMDDIRLDERLQTLLAVEQTRLKGGRDLQDVRDSLAQVKKSLRASDRGYAYDSALLESHLEEIRKIEDNLDSIREQQWVNRAEHAKISDRRQKLGEVITQGRGQKNVDILGQKVTFNEVAYGEHGNAFLAEASSGLSAGQTYAPGMQNNVSVSLAAAQHARQSIISMSAQDPNYFDHLWYIATRYFAGDPMFGQMLKAKTFDEMVEWAKSPAGVDHFKVLGREGKRYQETEMQAAYDLMYRLFPTQEARDMIGSGREFTAGEFQAAMLRPLEDGSTAKFENIVGPQLELAIPDGPTKAGTMVKRALQTAWNYIAVQPETRLARWPFYVHEFEKEWTQRASVLAAQGIDITPAVANAQRRAARQQALYALEKTFYNIRRYQNPVYALRYVSSFPGAFFNSIYRYAYYLPSRHPGNMLATINMTNAAFGAISVDENGQKSSFRDGKYLLIPTTGDPSIGDPGIRIPIDAVTRVFLDNPSRSWVVAVAMDSIANWKPDLYETIQKSSPLLGNYLFTEYGPQPGNAVTVAASAMMAPWQKGLLQWWQGQSDEEFRKQYAWAWYDTQAQMEKNNNYSMPDPDEVGRKASDWFRNQFITQFMSPISYKRDAPGQLERDTWNAIKDANPDLPYEQQKSLYFEKMGGEWADPYTASTSVDQYGLHGNYSIEAYNQIQKYADLAEELGKSDPKLVGLLATGANGTYSRAVYNNSRISGPTGNMEKYGRKKTPLELQLEFNVNEGWDEYNVNRERYRLMVAAAKKVGSSDVRKRADQAWWDFMNNTDPARGQLGLTVRNPDWANDLGAGGRDRVGNVARGLQRILGDKQFAADHAEDRNWTVIGLMLDTRDKVAYAVNRASSPEQARAIKDQYIAIFSQYADVPENSAFADLWDRYFSSEYAPEG